MNIRTIICTLGLIMLGTIMTAASDADATRSSNNYQYENHSLMYVPQLPAEMIPEFQKGYFDVARVMPDGSMQVVATSRDREVLITRFGARVEIENMEEFYRQHLDQTKINGDYRTYEQMYDELSTLQASYPSIARLDTIGYSLEGRPIYAFKISDNVEVDEEDEPEVQFNGMVHAREPMGLEICMTTINYLFVNQAEPEVADMINTMEIWFVPIINVDGYVYNETTNPGGGGMWRKNRRDNGDGSFGVDLNRNWGFKWAAYPNSSPDGSTEIYHGTGPFSEPATQVMREFINAHEFIAIVNYHSFGDIFITPFGVANVVGCPDNPLFDTYVSPAAILAGYDIGPFGVFGGDAACWQYAEQLEKPKALSYLVETATWFWPPAEERDEHCQRNLQSNLGLLGDIHDLASHPSMYLSTDLTNIDSTIDDCSFDFSHTFTFRYENEIPIHVDASFADLSPIEGWCTASTGFSGTMNQGDSFTMSFDFFPSSMFGMADGTVAQGVVNMVIYTLEGETVYDILDFRVRMAYSADDSDGDNLVACMDNCPMVYNPEQVDVDGDGVGDPCDNCWEIVNADQADADEDGAGDLCDICPGFDDFDDYDLDGVPDGCDNCVETANIDQEDTDEDGAGNLCDICPGHDDFIDSDEDGNPDGCDICPGYDDFVDFDEDGVPDSCDNCPEVANPEQNDSDENGVGDACQILCGDVNYDGQANVGDAVALISFIFKGGATPDPLCIGDANGDGDTNVGDAVYLIAYVFKGGPPPVDNCCP
jgi:hypothetical protein